MEKLRGELTPLSWVCPLITELSRQKYDWVYERMPPKQRPPYTMNNKEIRNKYVTALRNKFDALQERTEIRTPNDEYEDFVNDHLEAAAKYIPTKHRTKFRVRWVTLAIRKKRANMKTASKCNRKNLTNANVLKLKKAPNELASIYLKEQTEYMQNQRDKIRDSVEDRQSRIAWQTINKMSRRKSIAKAKLKAPNKNK